MNQVNTIAPLSQTLERARFALRVAVCRHCSARPSGSETLGADLPRTCECDCELFGRLPCLMLRAQCIDPLVGAFDPIMEGQLKRIAGSENAARPWARHMGRIVRILSNTVSHRDVTE